MKSRLLIAVLLMLVCAAVYFATLNSSRSEMRLSLGMSSRDLRNALETLGGGDPTPSMAMARRPGPPEPGVEGGWWEFHAYNAIMTWHATNGSVDRLTYWTKEDFSVSLMHRETSQQALRAITFDRNSKAVKVERAP